MTVNHSSASNLTRRIVFKYLGVSALIISLLSYLFYLKVPEFNHLLHRLILQPVLTEPIYYTIQIIAFLIITYIISGQIDKAIFQKAQSPYWTLFIGFVKIWFAVFLMTMLLEFTNRIAFNSDWNWDAMSLFLGLLQWCITLPAFLAIGATQGFFCAWFIGKELTAQKR